MFISLSKTLARVGGVRLGLGIRMTKNNIIWMSLIIMTIQIFKAMWYMMIVVFWLMYAMIYGVVWLYCKMFKTSIPLFKKLFDKFAEECNKKEGNQA